MAFFGLKKEKKGSKREVLSIRSNVGNGTRNLSSVLIAPRMTEKSASRNDVGMYTFVVRRTATKYDVRDAVQALFNVTPRKVTIVNRPPRANASRAKGRNVMVPGLKKANVFLKKGDHIDVA